MKPADATSWLVVGSLGVSGIAATFDWLTRRVPQFLTLGALLAGLAAHAWLAPPSLLMKSVGWSLLGALACGAPPLLFWFVGGIGAGDVKLMAAIGALLGPTRGLQAVFFALAFACSAVLLGWAWEGRLLRTVGRAVADAVPNGARHRDAVPSPVTRQTLRLGPFVFAGVVAGTWLGGGIG